MLVVPPLNPQTLSYVSPEAGRLGGGTGETARVAWSARMEGG